VLENLRLAREFTEGLSSAAELAADRKALYAVIRALEVVGEATKRVPQEIRDRAPGVPWAAMAGMRDRLIHGYREVDASLVWRTATTATVEAEKELRALLAALDAAASD
jgi:uncharacterized protein with HEPN domain